MTDLSLNMPFIRNLNIPTPVLPSLGWSILSELKKKHYIIKKRELSVVSLTGQAMPPTSNLQFVTNALANYAISIANIEVAIGD